MTSVARRPLLVRRHAHRLLAARAAHRATLVIAPAGYGKSFLLREAAVHDGSIFVEVREGSTFARFVDDLVEATAVLHPPIVRTLVGAFSRALQTDNPARTLAAWFTKHIAKAQCRLIIDGLDRIAEPEAAAFIRYAIASSSESTRWLVSARSVASFPTDSLLAYGHAAMPLDEADLRLRPDELRALAAAIAPDISESKLDVIARKADGNISAAFFLLRAFASGIPGVANPAHSLDSILVESFESLSSEEQEVALASTLIPTIEAAQRVGTRHVSSPLILERLKMRARHLFELTGARFQERFHILLKTEFAGLTPQNRDRLISTAANALESVGDIGGSLMLFARAHDEALCIRSIERLGASALESEQLYFLRDAIANLSEATRRSHPLVVAFLAMQASLSNQIDLAESLFASALSAAKDPTQAYRIRYWYACELLRRNRNDAIDLLRPSVEFFKTPPALRIAMMSTLGAAYCVDGRLQRGRRWIERALRGVDRLHDPALGARVYHHAAYLALCAEDAPEARRLAEEAAARAELAGTAHVVSSACSVLYSVAIDFEDDLPDAVRQLQRIGESGAHAGSVPHQLYALAAQYEVEADRCNVVALAAIDRELIEFDVQYGASVESETLLPAKAMQHAWSGQYERAFRMLAGSESQQFSDDRVALRSAEIAVYAAAAHQTRDADEALESALAHIHGCDVGLRALRARALTALALVLRDRCAQATTLLDQIVRCEPIRPSRIAALLDAIFALVERRTTSRVPSMRLVQALDEMRRLEWGGISRVIEMLPSDVVCAIPSVDRPSLACMA